MMASLVNKTKKVTLANNVRFAKSFFERLKGLLGESSLPENTTLWISSCNSVHTFFMKFTIDVIFVDKNMTVKKCYSRLTPWKVTLPEWEYDSVFELPSGSIEKSKTNVGDQLDVVS